jgi:anti-sigma-K factor RskA
MTDRRTLQEEDVHLAAEYALGVLQGPERQAFERRIAQEPALAAEVRDWDESLVGLADGYSPAPPPRQGWARIEARLFAASAADVKPSLWSSLGFWRGLAALSLAGVIGLGAWNVLVTSRTPATPTIIAQVQNEAAKLKLAVAFDSATNELRLNRLEGSPAAGRSLELWLIAGSAAPVSLGILPADATARITLPEPLRDKLVGSILAVSDEPEGGSPTGAPTGAVLATGELTRV